MVCTALLIAEVNVNVICAQGTPGVGLIALSEQVERPFNLVTYDAPGIFACNFYVRLDSLFCSRGRDRMHCRA